MSTPTAQPTEKIRAADGPEAEVDLVPKTSQPAVERPDNEEAEPEWEVYSIRERMLLFGASAFTYALALWIIVYNNWFSTDLVPNQQPLVTSYVSPHYQAILSTVFKIVGDCPNALLLRLTVVAMIWQFVRFMVVSENHIASYLECSRPLVFWRVVFRFLAKWTPFLRGQALPADGTPLTEYEAVTVRLVFVRMLFLPMMISIFFGNFQRLIILYALKLPPQNLDAWSTISHYYFLLYFTIMVVDVAYFAFCISLETARFSRIKMVDPNISGWLACLACYTPLNETFGRMFQWGVPDFPTGITATTSVPHHAGGLLWFLTHNEALYFALIGSVLYVIYVWADLSFGLKAGNLTYRDLVDKGPYAVIRHPMYATKTIAWLIFSLPLLNLHPDVFRIPGASGTLLNIPIIAANWGVLWGIIAWMSIYALRALTEERYLMEYPEYREYVKRVRYRFIPWVA